jgi:hypothetical protein
LCEEGNQVVNDVSLIDEIGEDSLEGASQGLAVVGVKDGLKNFEDAVVDRFVFHQAAL